MIYLKFKVFLDSFLFILNRFWRTSEGIFCHWTHLRLRPSGLRATPEDFVPLLWFWCPLQVKTALKGSQTIYIYIYMNSTNLRNKYQWRWSSQICFSTLLSAFLHPARLACTYRYSDSNQFHAVHLYLACFVSVWLCVPSRLEGAICSSTLCICGSRKKTTIGTGCWWNEM